MASDRSTCEGPESAASGSNLPINPRLVPTVSDDGQLLQSETGLETDSAAG